MKTSVIIATYNGARFIEEQLNSILAQTQLPDEVVISDDGSTDGTVDIVRQYIKDHELGSSWRLYINETNKGYAKNFLDGALLASGDIVFFCDQDDIWAQDRIERMSGIMSAQNDLNLLCTNLEPFIYESDTRKWSEKDLKVMTNDGGVERPVFDAANFHLKRSGCTMCVRRAFIDAIMPYWTDRWAHDDFVWKMATASDSCAIYQYCSMKRRMHANNATVIRLRTRAWRIGQLRDLRQQYESLRTYISGTDDTDKIAVVDENIASLAVRYNVVARRRIWEWPILCCKYRDCYPRIKGLYLDLYLAVFDKYEGAN